MGASLIVTLIIQDNPESTLLKSALPDYNYANEDPDSRLLAMNDPPVFLRPFLIKPLLTKCNVYPISFPIYRRTLTVKTGKGCITCRIAKLLLMPSISQSLRERLSLS